MSSRFATLRTGPKLAKRLAQVELGSLPDEAVLDYLHAQVRQLAFQQAETWAAMAEVERRAASAYAGDTEWTPERVFDCAAYEIVAELRVSKPYATHELGYAIDLEALPTVAAALRAGDIDRNRVLVLLEVCTGLSDVHRDQLIDRLLPGAGTQPPSKLRAEAQRLAIALDPTWAEKRYREAVRERRVICVIGQDGTVTLAGENLPADQALAAMAHVSALAKAAQRAGAAAPRSTLRAELFTGLLDNRFLGLNQRQIIAELVKQFPKPTDAQREDSASDHHPGADEPVADEPVDGRPRDDGSAAHQPADVQPTDDEPAAAATAREVLRERLERRREIARTARELSRLHCRRPNSGRDGVSNDATGAPPIRGPMRRNDHDPPPF